MYKKLPNLIIGFHGCCRDTAEKVISGRDRLKVSENIYDRPGHGIYFREHNYQRAFDWAISKYGDNATVIGAVIDPGFCLNLSDQFCASELNKGYNMLKARIDPEDMPKNRPSARSSEILLHDPDCAVIQQLHEFRSVSGLDGYDSVRGLFIEGNPVYPGSEIRSRTYIQLCVCNPNCIKGYFRPVEADNDYAMP